MSAINNNISTVDFGMFTELDKAVKLAGRNGSNSVGRDKRTYLIGIYLGLQIIFLAFRINTLFLLAIILPAFFGYLLLSNKFLYRQLLDNCRTLGLMHEPADAIVNISTKDVEKIFFQDINSDLARGTKEYGNTVISANYIIGGARKADIFVVPREKIDEVQFFSKSLHKKTRPRAQDVYMTIRLVNGEKVVTFLGDEEEAGGIQNRLLYEEGFDSIFSSSIDDYYKVKNVNDALNIMYEGDAKVLLALTITLEFFLICGLFYQLLLSDSPQRIGNIAGFIMFLIVFLTLIISIIYGHFKMPGSSQYQNLVANCVKQGFITDSSKMVEYDKLISADFSLGIHRFTNILVGNIYIFLGMNKPEGRYPLIIPRALVDHVEYYYDNPIVLGKVTKEDVVMTIVLTNGKRYSISLGHEVQGTRMRENALRELGMA